MCVCVCVRVPTSLLTSSCSSLSTSHKSECVSCLVLSLVWFCAVTFVCLMSGFWRSELECSVASDVEDEEVSARIVKEDICTLTLLELNFVQGISTSTSPKLPPTTWNGGWDGKALSSALTASTFSLRSLRVILPSKRRTFRVETSRLEQYFPRVDWRASRIIRLAMADD